VGSPPAALGGSWTSSSHQETQGETIFPPGLLELAGDVREEEIAGGQRRAEEVDNGLEILVVPTPNWRGLGALQEVRMLGEQLIGGAKLSILMATVRSSRRTLARPGGRRALGGQGFSQRSIGEKKGMVRGVEHAGGGLL
jgi:hypothetical protein